MRTSVWQTPWKCVSRAGSLVVVSWRSFLNLRTRPSRPATLLRQASSHSHAPSSTRHWLGCRSRRLLLRCTTCCAEKAVFLEKLRGEVNDSRILLQLISNHPRPAVVVRTVPTTMPWVEPTNSSLPIKSNEGLALSLGRDERVHAFAQTASNSIFHLCS
jgi:hypothetical protein